MKKILIIVFSDLYHDARVSRQIKFLKNNFNLTVVAFGGSTTEGFNLIKVVKSNLTLTKKIISAFFLLTRLYKLAYRVLHNYHHIKKELKGDHFDLIITNDIEALPLSFELSNSTKILFDAHEYAPRHFEDKLMWRIFFQGFNTYLCKKYIPKVKAMTTVGRGLAEEYFKNFGVRPMLVTNAAWFSDLKPSKVGENQIRMIHHGISTPSRKLELMITMMKYLDDRFTLDLMLIVPPVTSAKTRGYIDRLKSLAKDDVRINFLSAIKSSEIAPFINQYDIGVFLLPPVNFNYANTLPNKLFDFIQAKLAIAIGPTPEMAEIVNRYNNGVVAKDFTPKSLAQKLSELTKEKVAFFKSQSVLASKDLSAETNQETLISLVNSII